MIILFLAILLTHTSSTDVIDIRKQYVVAANDKQAAKKLLTVLEKKSNANHTLLGYQGAVMMVMAKYHFNPVSKLNSFQSGKLLLEKSILHAPENIELRYLRLTIQYHAPIFLDYNKSIQQDKAFIMNMISGVKDVDLANRIAKFLFSTDLLTTQERAKLNHFAE
jgi:hypothetical protein